MYIEDSDAVVLEVPEKLQLSDDGLYGLCAVNRELMIERTSFGRLVIMPLAGCASSMKTTEINTDLGLWNRKSQLGIAFDSNGGFILPNNAMRCPDSAWITNERWKNITPEKRKKFAPICPDFVIELRSESDSFKYLKIKMEEWIENGCRLGWLIDPLQQKVYIYRGDGSKEVLESFEKAISGEDVLPGFLLSLSNW
jgi:Uma2 family endonuclease